jgi:ATP-dependent DNA ligase
VLYEIKHDGYRLMVRRTTDGVCIKTRRGFDWTDRFPVIVEAAARLRANSFVLDGEGVILRPDGVADFDRLHARRHDGEAQLLGFDLLELDGTDLRREPLESRKATLASLLRRSRHAIQFVEHIEAADGGTVFEHACKLGLEGIVSMRRDKPYQHGRSRAWLKIKNPSSPAMLPGVGAAWPRGSQVADFKGVVDGIERDYANAKAVAKAMAERDPEVRLH